MNNLLPARSCHGGSSRANMTGALPVPRLTRSKRVRANSLGDAPVARLPLIQHTFEPLPPLRRQCRGKAIATAETID